MAWIMGAPECSSVPESERREDDPFSLKRTLDYPESVSITY